MSLRAPKLSQCQTALLDWTDTPLTETSIISNRITVHETFSQLPKYCGGGSLDFFLEPSNAENLCLFQSFINLHLKVVKMVDGVETDLEKDDVVSFVPLIAHSIIKSVSISINDEDVTSNTSSANYYPYEAYVSSLVHLSRDEQRTMLDTASPCYDTPGSMLILDPMLRDGSGALVNPGLNARYGLAAYSLNHEFTTPLLHPLFLVPRLLPTGVELKLRLTLNSPEFCLIVKPEDDEAEDDEDDETDGETGARDDAKKRKKKSSGELTKKGQSGQGKKKEASAKKRPKRAVTPGEPISYQVKVDMARLYVQRYRLAPPTLTRMEQILRSGGALYPMIAPKSSSFIVEKNSTEVSRPLIFSGLLPSMVYVMLVGRDTIENLHSTPFRFHHFNYSEIWMESDGPEAPCWSFLLSSLS